MKRIYSTGEIRALREKIRFYEMIFDRTPALIYINTITEPGNPHSVVNTWNNLFARTVMGYSSEEIEAMGSGFFREVIHPDDIEVIKTSIETLPGLEGNFTYMCRLKPKNKTDYIWVYGSGIALDVYEGGLPRTFLSIIIEVTNQMHTDNQLIIALKEINRLKNGVRCQMLSRREREILCHIAKGYTDKEISEMLYISPKTAKTHRNNTIKKLGFKNTASLAAFAVECGLL